MSEPEPVRLEMEVDSPEPIRGRIGRSGEELGPFTGWTGLASALERLIKPASQPGKDKGADPVARR